jgi:WD40 repeat protein/energy-coupling factor transporter ATP-binding protein EcfA2
MLTNSLQSEEIVTHPEDQTSFAPGTTNPFPGLRPFTVDECHLFFGREGQVDDILLKLSQNRFVCVMGYSGSGKSSLMYCGLVPVLYGGFVTHSGPHWHIIVTRPGTAPIQNLADSIVDYLIAQNRIAAADRNIHNAIILSVLRSGSHGLVEVARFLQKEHQENVFLMIDQFEELFRLQEEILEEDAINESQQYVNLLLTAVHQREVPIFSAVTMRSDFIASCSVFPHLTDEINKSNYLVPQMSREQRKMVIEGPVAVGGGKISQRLVKRLLTDMGKNQDQLPILQHALMRTWDYWLENREEGEPMDLRHYNAIGKVSQALSQHANELYEALSSREKEIAEVLFKSITEKTADNKGMRRPSKLSLLSELADASEEEVIKVIEHFRKPGRSFLMPAHYVPLNSDSVIELSHESLMRIWNKLYAWVEEEFESAQMYKRLSDAAAMYQIGKTGLWRPPDLQLALNWQKKQRPTREWAQRYDEAFERAIVFLDTSRITYEAELKNQEMLQKRVLRRARITAIVLGIAALIAILFFVFAQIQTIEATRSSELASQREKEATTQKAIAEKQTEIATKERKEAVEAKDRAEKLANQLAEAYTEVQRQVVITRQALKNAQEQEAKAVAAGEKEREANEVAQNKTAEALKNYNDALRQLMLNKAQALAGKSVQEEDDSNLAGLQAMQAFHYHKRAEGKYYDPYIYNGLYHALKELSGTTYNAIKVQGPSRNRMNSVAVSTKSAQFYAAAADGRIFSGNYETLKGKPTGFENPYPNRIVALSADENYLANGTDSANVQIFNLANPKSKPILVTTLTGATNDIEFLPDNSGFAVSKTDKTISIVNHLTGKVTSTATLPFELKSLSVNPNGKQLVAGTWSGELVLLDIPSMSYKVALRDTGAQILSVRFSPDGKKIAYGTFEIKTKRGLVKMFDLDRQRKDDRQFTGHKAGVYDVEFSPDGKLLASAGSDKRLQMWVLDNPNDLPIVMDNNNGFIWDIAFAKGSDYLIAACHESELRVWPTSPELLASQVCPKLSRNMTQDEWNKYVGTEESFPYETTCPNLLIKPY